MADQVSTKAFGSVEADLIKEVQRLLNLEDSAADPTWARLSDDELTAEIQAYRQKIKELEHIASDRTDEDALKEHAKEDTEPENKENLPPANELPGEAAELAEGPAADDIEGPADDDIEGPADDDIEPNEYAHLGEEGVDYTLGSVDDLDPSEWQVPPYCIPIHANVTTFKWESLYNSTQFDVIMMDPPWQLATANPTRGVSLGYSQLTDDDITRLPIPQLQSEGLLFIWVINAKYKFTLDLFEQWGYRLVDEIVWVKMTINRRLAKSHGYYLQHAKEVCLVGHRGQDMSKFRSGVGSDVIFSERRGQSQKPEEIYELIEELVPGGKFLEIFARKNNLHNFWVSVGNEVTGTGLPKEDMSFYVASSTIPGAVYGRGAP